MPPKRTRKKAPAKAQLSASASTSAASSSASLPDLAVKSTSNDQSDLYHAWSAYSPDKSTTESVLAIVKAINLKFRDGLVGVWDVMTKADDQEVASVKFSELFHSAMKLNLDPALPMEDKLSVLEFTIRCFQSLENNIVRTECLKLVQLTIYSNLSPPLRLQKVLSEQPQLVKLWKHLNKRYNSSSDEVKERLDFEKHFLSKFMIQFLDVLNSIPLEQRDAKIFDIGTKDPNGMDMDTEADGSSVLPEDPNNDEVTMQSDSIEVKYLERFLEFLIDLLSQLPTRRYFNTLFADHHILVSIEDSQFTKQQRSKKEAEKILFIRLLDMLKFYANFEMDDFTGASLTEDERLERHEQRLMALQRLAFTKFRESLMDLALTNIAAIDTPEALESHFSALSSTELHALCSELAVRTQPISNATESSSTEPYPTAFIVKALIQHFQRRPSHLSEINSTPLYPTELDLFSDPSLITAQSFTHDHPLALPKLNLQFLTIHDYLLRNFTLFRLESNYEIRQDVEDVVERMAPRWDYSLGRTVFTGWARMAVPISRFDIVEVGKMELELEGRRPRTVKADVTFNLSRYTDSIRHEWDQLKPHDVCFLISLVANPTTGVEAFTEKTDFRSYYGIKYIRGCEIADVLNEEGNSINVFNTDADKKPRGGSQRTIRVLLDSNQYMRDMDEINSGAEDLYTTFNIIMRRKPQENNFKSILSTIRSLMQSDVIVPNWLHNTFLGYGDPKAVTRENMLKTLEEDYGLNGEGVEGAKGTELLKRVGRQIDFNDTFLDSEHLKECWDKNVVPSPPSTSLPTEPPFVLTFTSSPPNLPTGKSTKRKNKNDHGPDKEISDVDNKVLVNTYKKERMGPYKFMKAKRNGVRFTKAQVQAIYSGTCPGLTLVVGPPGTGKTDVAVQIISNLYHNFPNQKTLLVTHSNQALNSLFEKIVKLDIDPRHLLRLGHGEEELELESGNKDGGEGWGKAGRVASFLEKRLQLLSEVSRLSNSLSITGEHASTCETASYFFTYHILSKWEPYFNFLSTKSSLSVSDIITHFPFTNFFSFDPSGAPLDLFCNSDGKSVEDVKEEVMGCWRYIKNIFEQLEEVRAFELLRTERDRSNYLLVKEARIVALTCTHAALKRDDLVSLGFKYDNIIMEESAQILEIETFIPMLLQSIEAHDRAKDTGLKRVVLIGDHHQLPPVVKNMPLARHANMEQSMFARLIRLGVPYVQLDKQGRARPSIASLYSWRYTDLTTLPHISGISSFSLANPGFLHPFQFINVEDYNKRGESAPVPYFYQNLGEAEYVVAVYQYMRLLGYPAEKIAILTTYNGQKALIKDVLKQRCSWNSMFGKPSKITTVDKYQGQQNDYILLSLVRTKHVGHIRDVRRLIVAMSRARLGLYIFGRQSLFEKIYELEPVFSQLLNKEKGTKLKVVSGEMFGKCERKESDVSVESNTIEDVVHMGAFVYQMMQEQVQHVRKHVVGSDSEAVNPGNDGEGGDEQMEESGDGRAEEAAEDGGEGKA